MSQKLIKYQYKEPLQYEHSNEKNPNSINTNQALKEETQQTQIQDQESQRDHRVETSNVPLIQNSKKPETVHDGIIKTPDQKLLNNFDSNNKFNKNYNNLNANNNNINTNKSQNSHSNNITGNNSNQLQLLQNSEQQRKFSTTNVPSNTNLTKCISKNDLDSHTQAQFDMDDDDDDDIGDEEEFKENSKDNNSRFTSNINSRKDTIKKQNTNRRKSGMSSTLGGIGQSSTSYNTEFLGKESQIQSGKKQFAKGVKKNQHVALLSKQGSSNNKMGFQKRLMQSLGAQSKEKFKEKFRKAKLKQILVNFLDNTEIRRLKRLTIDNYNLINDKSYMIDKNSNKTSLMSILFHKLYRKIKKLLLINKMYEPESNVAFCYDVIAASFIMFWMFIYSMHIFFLSQAFVANVYIQILLVISNLFFASEFLMRFHIGFYENGKLVTDKRQISQRYKNTSMIYDILGFMAQIYNFIDQSLSVWNIVFELIFFLKYRSLSRTIQRIEWTLYLKGISTHILELVQMLFQLVLMSHAIASMWHILAFMEKKYLQVENTWLDVYGLDNDEDWIKRYIESFYWAVATIMLVGSKGETPYEVVFTIITLLWTVCIFAYLISKISMIIEAINKKQQDFKQDLEIINKYMDSKSLNKDIQSKVRSSLEFYYKSSDEMNIQESAQDVLKRLPKSLQDQVEQQANQIVFNKFPFVWKQLSKQTQEDIKSLMKEYQYVTNEYIFEEDKMKEITDENDIKVYFILKGRVELRHKRQFTISTLKQGNILADLNFFQGTRYEYSAKCQSYVSAACISRLQLLEILKKNPEDFEKFLMIKDYVILNEYAKMYTRKCIICQRYDHDERYCNLLSYEPNRYFISRQQNSTLYTHKERNKNHKRRLTKQSIAQNIHQEDFQDVLSKLEYYKDIKQYRVLLGCHSSSGSSSDYFSDEEDEEDFFKKKSKSGTTDKMAVSAAQQILNKVSSFGQKPLQKKNTINMNQSMMNKSNMNKSASPVKRQNIVDIINRKNIIQPLSVFNEEPQQKKNKKSSISSDSISIIQEDSVEYQQNPLQESKQNIDDQLKQVTIYTSGEKNQNMQKKVIQKQLSNDDYKDDMNIEEVSPSNISINQKMKNKGVSFDKGGIYQVQENSKISSRRFYQEVEGMSQEMQPSDADRLQNKRIRNLKSEQTNGAIRSKKNTRNRENSGITTEIEEEDIQIEMISQEYISKNEISQQIFSKAPVTNRNYDQQIQKEKLDKKQYTTPFSDEFEIEEEYEDDFEQPDYKLTKNEKHLLKKKAKLEQMCTTLISMIEHPQSQQQNQQNQFQFAKQQTQYHQNPELMQFYSPSQVGANNPILNAPQNTPMQIFKGELLKMKNPGRLNQQRKPFIPKDLQLMTNQFNNTNGTITQNIIEQNQRNKEKKLKNFLSRGSLVSTPNNKNQNNNVQQQMQQYLPSAFGKIFQEIILNDQQQNQQDPLQQQQSPQDIFINNFHNNNSNRPNLAHIVHSGSTNQMEQNNFNNFSLNTNSNNYNNNGLINPVVEKMRNQRHSQLLHLQDTFKDRIQIQEQQEFENQFENIKNWNIYFPNNNFSNIIRRMKYKKHPNKEEKETRTGGGQDRVSGAGNGIGGNNSKKKQKKKEQQEKIQQSHLVFTKTLLDASKA